MIDMSYRQVLGTVIIIIATADRGDEGQCPNGRPHKWEYSVMQTGYVCTRCDAGNDTLGDIL